MCSGRSGAKSYPAPMMSMCGRARGGWCLRLRQFERTVRAGTMHEPQRHELAPATLGPIVCLPSATTIRTTYFHNYRDENDAHYSDSLLSPYVHLLRPLKPKLALHRTHHKSPLLLCHILIHIVCPTRTIHRQIIHAITHVVQFLCSLVHLARGPSTPAFICRRRTGRVGWVSRIRRGSGYRVTITGITTCLFGFRASLCQHAFRWRTIGAADWTLLVIDSVVTTKATYSKDPYRQGSRIASQISIVCC
jgi:hypothetical protein